MANSDYSRLVPSTPSGDVLPLVVDRLRAQLLPAATTKALVGEYKGEPVRFQGGITNVTTNATGDSWFTYQPAPFPNGVLTVVMTPLDISTGGIIVKINRTAGTNLKDTAFRAYDSMGKQLPNFSCWFTWFALGW